MTASSSDTYVVVATQINRFNATSKESTQLHRGDTFTAADVAPDELDRWLKIKPAPVMTQADYAKRQEQTPLGAAQRIAQLEAELAALRGDDSDESGGDHATDSDDDGKLDVPADNASAAAWREYAGATPDLSDEDRAALGTMSRDDIRAKYKPKS